nr:GNAT family N-acetyltransferase [Brucella intermedia]
MNVSTLNGIRPHNNSLTRREMTQDNTNRIVYRPATPNDAATCMEIRGRTRENAFSEKELNALGITKETWADDIRNGSMPGYVCCVDGTIAGYCFGDKDSGEVVVLALLPEYEGIGIGKALLNRIVSDFRSMGFRRLFLGCAADPVVRSYGFYRHLGWSPTGERDELGDDILELLLD